MDFKSALQREQALTRTLESEITTLGRKGVGGLLGNRSTSVLGQFGSTGAVRAQYAQFKGWLYAAVHAICMKAAAQPVTVARLQNVPQPVDERTAPPRIKGWNYRQIQRRCSKSTVAHYASLMPQYLQKAVINQDMEILIADPLVDALEKPNFMQSRWQFVYSFIANLHLTGWSYVIGGEVEGGMEFFSLPTHWIQPNADFSEFKIIDPKNPSANSEVPPLTRENVGFAYLPNPSDLMSALAPALAQGRAIQIDDNIQSSQINFFDNGIFPSVVVTIGRDPHPEVASGVRPRLTQSQRHQITLAIQKAQGGVEHYGDPAIIDGLIESIERVSATQNEMGWEKSEMTTRTRILSAFGVHPFILGEPINVGGHAQAFVIENQFCQKVNTFLDMLSNLMTNFAGPTRMTDVDIQVDNNKVIIFWEQCQARDLSIRSANMRQARLNGDVSRNEWRSFLGLPPDEDGGDRNHQFDAQDMVQIQSLVSDVLNGKISRESGKAMLMTGYDLTDDEAEEILGPEDFEPTAPMIPPQLMGDPTSEEDDGEENENDEEDEEDDDEEDLERAIDALQKVIAVIPQRIAKRIVE